MLINKHNSHISNVLVIGSGGAGLRAAIEAKQAGMMVAIIGKRKGSLTIDDEGTPTEKTVLIENGILKNFMQDRLNARLMKTKSTGSGRRENLSRNI